MGNFDDIPILNDQEYDFEQEFSNLQKSVRLFRANAFEDGIDCIIEGAFKGTPCAFADKVAFRPAEVTLWGGINGHGKSLITGQVALQLVSAKQTCAIMSFEMSPARTLHRMLRQSVGHKPVIEDVMPWLLRVSPHLVLLDHVGCISKDQLLGAIAVSQRDFGAKHIFVDNLMKVVSGDDDYNSQKNFVQSLCEIAHDLGVHIHLIHHVRKGGSESDQIDKFSFKGTTSIVDQVDNAILIQRNRTKELSRQKGELTLSEDEATGDSLLKIVKQRNGDWEGEVPLWFDPESTAFCTSVNRRPLLSIPNAWV